MEKLFNDIKKIYPEDTLFIKGEEISIIDNWLNVSKYEDFYYLNMICNDCGEESLLLQTQEPNKIIEIINIIERE